MTSETKVRNLRMRESSEKKNMLALSLVSMNSALEHVGLLIMLLQQVD